MSSLNLGKVLDGGGKDFRSWLRRGLYGGGAVVGAQLLSAWACTRWNEHRVFVRISGGSRLAGRLVSGGVAARHWQRREELMAKVSRLLLPGADLPSDAYYCVLGSPNSGKTHIMRMACQEAGAGVIYINVTVPDMFGSELAQAIDYHGGALNVINMVQNNVLKAVFGSGSSEEKDDTDQALEALATGARAYQRKHRKPVVLVLDDVDRLAEKQAGLLEELQGHAKAWSNQGLVRIVFVLSDGVALSQLKRRSSWSRANVSGFVTVGDVNRGEAFHYLRGRGVSDDDAEAIYEVVGGRLGVLSHVATSVSDMKIPTEDVLDSVMEAAADEFKVAGLLDEGARRNGGMAAITALLEAGGADDDLAGISTARWSQMVPQATNQRALLASRVFTKHYPSQKVMFGSRPTALYARRLVDEQRAARGSVQDDSAASSNEPAPAERRQNGRAGKTEAAAAAGGASDQRGGGECESGGKGEGEETVEGETEVLQEVAAWRIGGLSKPVSSHKGKVRKRGTRGLGAG